MEKPEKSFFHFWLVGTLSALTLLIVSMCFFHNDSFSRDKIRPSQHFSFQATINHSKKELEQVKEILRQPFTYLTEGSETYVFVSEDQKHVLKFFKMRRMTPKYWLNYIPLPWLDKKRLSKIDERERMKQEFFRGLKIAEEKFSYQTGLTFLHLFRTEYLKMKVKLKDLEGRAHSISLDHVPFILQKKTEILSDHIGRLTKEGKEEEAVQALCQILNLVKSSCQKGFTHPCEKIDCDYGFLEGRAIYISGIFVAKDDPSSKGTLKEVFTFSKALESWTQHNYPNLLSSFQEEVQDLLSCLED